MHAPAEVPTNSQTHNELWKARSLELSPVYSTSKGGRAASFRRAIVAAEALADLVTITLSVALAYRATYDLWLGRHIYYPARTVLGLAFALSVVMILMLDRAGAYGRGNSLLRVRETEQVLRVCFEAFCVAFVATLFSRFLFSRWLLLLSLILVPLALFVQKTLVYLLVRALHSRGYGIEKVLIYGSGATGRRVFSVLKRSPKLGLDPVAFIDDDPGKVGSTVFEMAYDRRRCAPVVQGPVSKALLAHYGADLVIVAIPSIGRDSFMNTVDEALGANVRVSYVPSQFLHSDPVVDYQDFDGVFLASFGNSAQKMIYDSLKRAGDVAGALLLTILGAPFLLFLAFFIRVDSPGPALFRQQRVGLNGRLFQMYKFRTMYSGVSPYEFSPQSPDDPRITRVGRFLRRTSLDEAPQLLNVLQGSMSLVGPRPEMSFIVQGYSNQHRQRLCVKPGLTGLWQLSGDRAFLIHENLEYDLYYIQHRNVFMDLAILLHTSIFAMRGI
jgi:exopolysaccharide biosynthesis polyprenyl glycosylphosphotransferase